MKTPLVAGLLLLSASLVEAGPQRSRTSGKYDSGRRPAATPIVPPFPQYYIKAQDGSAIPVTPVFLVPPPAPAPTPTAKPTCYRFFCD